MNAARIVSTVLAAALTLLVGCEKSSATNAPTTSAAKPEGETYGDGVTRETSVSIAEILGNLDTFYTDAVEGGLYDPNGGGEKAAMADLEWYSGAGQLEGDPSELNIEDFWYLEPLKAATQ